MLLNRFNILLYKMHIMHYPLVNFACGSFTKQYPSTVERSAFIYRYHRISTDKYFYFSQFTNKDISCHDKIFTIIFQSGVFIVLCGRNITRNPVPLESRFFSTFITRPFLQCPKTYEVSFAMRRYEDTSILHFTDILNYEQYSNIFTLVARTEDKYQTIHGTSTSYCNNKINVKLNINCTQFVVYRLINFT